MSTCASVLRLFVETTFTQFKTTIVHVFVGIRLRNKWNECEMKTMMMFISSNKCGFK